MSVMLIAKHVNANYSLWDTNDHQAGSQTQWTYCKLDLGQDSINDLGTT